jgi:hypothetical protein
MQDHILRALPRVRFTHRSERWWVAMAIAASALLAGCTIVIDAGGYRGRDGALADAGRPDGQVDLDGRVPTDAPGACDPACVMGETCVDGVCRCGTGTGCGEGSACCGGSCRSLGTVSACASCDDECVAPVGTTARCEPGVGCAFECQAGFASCDTSNPDCEQSLVTNTHCGACGNACGAGELCAVVDGATRCVSSCPSGQIACSGACVETGTSVLHCGRCENACPDPAFGAPVCRGGMCGVECEPGYATCGGSTCVALVTYYTDFDGDGFGSSTGMTRRECPGTTLAGFVPNSGDCDDTRGWVRPGATESCNGVDEDCNGLVDDGFTCAPGATRSCTVTSGACMAAGTQTCTGMCGWGPCVATDRCDRTDDNCDGLVDDGALVLATMSGTIAPVGMYRYSEVHADYSPSRREVGVLYGAFSGSSWPVYFARIDPATGATLAAPVMVAVASASVWDLVWDGAHWTAVMSEGTSTHVYRIEAASDRVTRVQTIDSTAAAHTLSVGRLGTSGSNVVVAWGASAGRVVRLTMPASASAAPTVIGSTAEPLPSSSGYASTAVVATTPTGALVIFVRMRSPGDLRDLWMGPVPSTGAVGAFRSFFSGTEGLGVRAAYEPSSGLVGVALTRSSASGSRSSFLTFDTGGTTASPELALMGPEAHAIVYSGEPGQLGVFTGRFYPAAGQIERVRVAERTTVPSPISIGTFQGMVGVPEGPSRFLVFGDDTDLRATAVVCR